MLVGNKSDMSEKRRVTYEEGQELGIIKISNLYIILYII